MTDIARCAICGEPMPPGEEMFKFHGFSGKCPKPPLPRPIKVDENMLLRKLLWLMHGCTALYGDDGEMQCNCGNHPPIDFKRDSVEEIDRKIQTRR